MAAAGKIIILTINTNGLHSDKTKRIAFFLWLKTLIFDIIFLQETHCGSEYEDNNTSPSMSPSSILAEKLSEVVEAASGGTVGLTGGSISLANAVKSLCPAVVCTPSALKQEQQ